MYKMIYRRRMLGKLIGAFLGFLFLGNIFGALLGFIIGNIFDRGLRLNLRSQRNNGRSYQSSRVQNVYFKATFMVMGHIAKADGVVTEDEIKVAQSVMKKMELSYTKKRQAINYFNSGKQTNFQLEPVLTELLQNCRQQRLLLRMFVEIQFQAAMANRHIAPQQRVILEQICKRLGIRPLFYQHQSYNRHRSSGYSRYNSNTLNKSNSLQQAYATLEIPQSASKDEIKRAYRKLTSKHHPDKLMAKDLPKNKLDKMIKDATAKTQKIRAAYETIKESRGI